MDNIVILVTLLGCANLTLAYPNGAPSTACVDLQARHNWTAPQTSSPPYVVELSSDYYSGNAIDVAIRGVDGTTFRGFICQFRSYDSIIGRFDTNNEDDNVQMVWCGEDSDTVTHTGRSDKNAVSFKWEAPFDDFDDVSIVCTIVQRFNTYWLAHKFETVSYAEPYTQSAANSLQDTTMLYDVLVLVVSVLAAVFTL